MKLQFLNTLPKRIGFSFGLAALITLILYFPYGEEIFRPRPIAIITMLTFIPVTIFYAAVSTFFEEEEKEKDDPEILDN